MSTLRPRRENFKKFDITVLPPINERACCLFSSEVATSERAEPFSKMARNQPCHDQSGLRHHMTGRVEINSEVRHGKPVIRGTRIPVEILLRNLGNNIGANS